MRGLFYDDPKMRYTVTATYANGDVSWTKEVAANCFEQAIGLAVRGARMDGVHSVTATKV